MDITLTPGRLRGTVRVPSSKSQAHRALIASALSDGLTAIHLNGLNEDIEATADALMALGALIDYDPRKGLMVVRPIESAPNLSRVLESLSGKAQSHVDYDRVLELDCGESGSTLRFLLPVACALGVRARLTGRGRLPQRPNGPLTGALRAHGADIDGDCLPMAIAGGLRGGSWALPGNVSSQYITGLLFALPLLDEDSDLRLTTPLQSTGYVDMTLESLRDFGIRIDTTDGGFTIPGRQSYHTPEDVYVEGDWSAGAFWHAANALVSSVAIEGLSLRSTQGDRAIVDLLGRAEIVAQDVPDLVPVLAAVAAARPGRTAITGAGRLRYKESDRLKATADMIIALGGRAVETEEGLIIDGGPIRGGTVQGYNDHRIVMAAAILATVAEGPVTITDSEAVAKSYPAFFEDFYRLSH